MNRMVRRALISATVLGVLIGVTTRSAPVGALRASASAQTGTNRAAFAVQAAPRALKPSPSGPLNDGWLTASNETLSLRMSADHAWLWRHGIKLREWAPDPVTGKLKVWLAQGTPTAGRALRERYGSAIVLSGQISPPGHLLGRANDSANFAAGALISIPATNENCTSGPTIITNGTTSPKYMLTAGHCVAGELGLTVTSNGHVMGSSVHIRDCNNCLDSAVINGNDYQNNIWGGAAWDENPPANPPAYAEDGTAFPAPGTFLTNDSSYSGEITHIQVLYNNLTFCITGTLCIIDLSEAWNGSNDEICEPGDSGGPWIVHEGSTQYVHIAGTTDIGQYGVSGTDGFSVCYYEQIGNLLSRWNSYVPAG